eukprot:Platyproteum_vivax@DN4430_c0_g1_i3.p1
MEVVEKMMSDPKRMLGLPCITFCYSDVRDVARAHVLAMKSWWAANHRFLVCEPKARSFANMAEVITNLNEGEYAKRYKLYTNKMPKTIMILGQTLVPSLAQFLERWGVEQEVDITPAQK